MIHPSCRSAPGRALLRSLESCESHCHKGPECVNLTKLNKITIAKLGVRGYLLGPTTVQRQSNDLLIYLSEKGIIWKYSISRPGFIESVHER